MDVLMILDKLKDKVLDVGHVELLRSAYQLQEQNVNQLKTNNQVLRESLELTKEQIVALKGELARIQKENADLHAQVSALPRDVEYQPSRVALEIVRALVKSDDTSFYDELLSQRIECSRMEFEAAIDELEDQGILTFGGSNFEGNYYVLTDDGKRFAIQNSRRE